MTSAPHVPLMNAFVFHQTGRKLAPDQGPFRDTRAGGRHSRTRQAHLEFSRLPEEPPACAPRCRAAARMPERGLETAPLGFTSSFCQCKSSRAVLRGSMASTVFSL